MVSSIQLLKIPPDFSRKLYRMNMLSFRKHLRAVSSALTSLLLASGCHYSGGSSSTPGYSEYDSITMPPFYRSFQRPQPYDNEPQNPEPPSVLPAPGYSEPNDVPPPPTPSAKKLKFNLFQTGFKFPGINRQNGQVNQTTARNSKQSAGSNGSSGLPELSSTPSAVNRSASITNDLVDDEAPLKSVSKQDDVELNQAPVKISRKNRSASLQLQQWPIPKSAPRIQAADEEFSESNAASSTNAPSTGRSSAGQAPSLLPPPL